jgi:hypothetical protein
LTATITKIVLKVALNTIPPKKHNQQIWSTITHSKHGYFHDQSKIKYFCGRYHKHHSCKV